MNLLRLYRILGWRQKLPLVRLMGYLFLGYAFGLGQDFVRVPWRPLLLNTLAILGLLMFSFASNDFYDYFLEGDENYLGCWMERKGLGRRRALFLSSLPLPLVFLSLPYYPSFFLALGALLLFAAYSLPPLRLKGRRVGRVLISPLVALLLFFEGALLLGGWSPVVLQMGTLVFLFHCYMEGLHFLDDMEAKLPEKNWVFRRVRLLPLLPLAVSLLFSFSNPLFLTTTVFSAFRMYTLRPSGFHEQRARLLEPPVLAEEFLIYAGGSLLGLL